MARADQGLGGAATLNKFRATRFGRRVRALNLHGTGLGEGGIGVEPVEIVTLWRTACPGDRRQW